MYFEPKSPKSPRKFDFIEQRSPKFDYSDFDEYHPMSNSPIQQQQQQQQHTHQKLKRTTNLSGNGNSNILASGQRSPTISNHSNNSKYGYDQQQQQQQQPLKSPKSPRKFDYESISPKYEQKGKKKIQFDYHIFFLSDSLRLSFYEIFFCGTRELSSSE